MAAKNRNNSRGSKGGSYSSSSSSKGNTTRQSSSSSKGDSSYNDDRYSNNNRGSSRTNSNQGYGPKPGSTNRDYNNDYNDDYNSGNGSYPSKDGQNNSNDRYSNNDYNDNGYGDNDHNNNGHSTKNPSRANDDYDSDTSSPSRGNSDYNNDNSYSEERLSKGDSGYNDEPINDPPYDDYDHDNNSDEGNYNNNDNYSDNENYHNSGTISKLPPHSRLSSNQNGDQANSELDYNEDNHSNQNYNPSNTSSIETSKGGGNTSNERRETSTSNSNQNEWNRRRTPRDGETLMGHTIRVTVTQLRNGRTRRNAQIELDGRIYKITKYRSQPYGIIYGGRASLTRQAVSSISNRYRQQNDLFMAKAVESYNVLGEGGFSSINTYDDQIFTLGTGLAGGRLNRFLQNLRGTDLGSRISEISYFNNLRFNRSSRIRLDINALHQIVQLFESDQNNELLGREFVNDYLQQSLKINHATPQQRQWIVQNNIRPELLGIAAYMRHGRPRYTPSPIRDVIRAERQLGSNLSKKVAFLMKLHAQRIFLDRNSSERVGGGPSGRQASPAVLRRLPKKPSHFQRAMRNSGQQFTFNYNEAREIIPCIRPHRNSGISWETSSRRPSGVYLQHENHYFNFGSRI